VGLEGQPGDDDQFGLLEVFQGGKALEDDPNHEGRWHLESLDEEIVLDDGVTRTKLPLNTSPFLLFKLSGDRGMQLNRLSTGYHLLISRSGRQFEGTVDPEATQFLGPSTVAGHDAYLIYNENGVKTTFFCSDSRISLGDGASIPQIELVGRHLLPKSQEQAPLFQFAPRLQADSWQSIAKIVVGEEGGGRGRWRTSFRPDSQVTIQDLPDSLHQRGGGWYFLRLYDGQGQLLDSFDFRFLPSLHGIEVKGGYFGLSATGNPMIEMVHTEECDVRCLEASGLLEWDTQAEGRTIRTLATVAATPKSDRLTWAARTEHHEIEFVTELDRVWWVVGEGLPSEQDWQRKKLPFKGDYFRATSESQLWLRFPRTRWVKELQAGFTDGGPTRPVPFRVSRQVASVPLREFGDDNLTIAAWTRDFKVSLVTQTGRTDASVVGELEITATCRECGFSTKHKSNLCEHIGSHHLDANLRHMTYSDMRRLVPELSKLPEKIFICPHGGKDGCQGLTTKSGFRGDPKPQDDMYYHLLSKHKRRERILKPVEDPDKIREYVIADLPRISVCVLCERTGRTTQFHNSSAKQNDILIHLIEKHHLELYDLN
jgi:hypothetical protein